MPDREPRRGPDLGLTSAETALQCATNRREAQHAIREYFAARKEARTR